MTTGVAGAGGSQGPPLVVVNPRAANGRVGRRWNTYRARLEGVLGPFEARHTTHAGHAESIVREALAAGHRWIASLGGDGTHHQVANGLFEGGEPVLPEATLSVLPVGTGGDFQRMLDADGARDLEGFARAALAGPSRSIDAGWLSFVTDEGVASERVFLNVASLGLGGLVDRIVNAGSKALGGPLTFLVGTLRGLLRYQAPRVRLVVDGQPLEPGRVLAVAACNGGYFGGGMHVGPGARLDDGWLELVVLPWRGVTRQLLRGADIYLGRHVLRSDIQHLRFRELRAEADVDCFLDVDGEAPGRLPLTLKVLPGALRFRGRLRSRAPAAAPPVTTSEGTQGGHDR